MSLIPSVNCSPTSVCCGTTVPSNIEKSFINNSVFNLRKFKNKNTDNFVSNYFLPGVICLGLSLGTMTLQLVTKKGFVKNLKNIMHGKPVENKIISKFEEKKESERFLAINNALDATLLAVV